MLRATLWLLERTQAGILRPLCQRVPRGAARPPDLRACAERDALKQENAMLKHKVRLGSENRLCFSARHLIKMPDSVF